MFEITETIFIPEREIFIQPTTIKEFNGGSKLIEYHWQGAEYAHIGEWHTGVNNQLLHKMQRLDGSKTIKVINRRNHALYI